MKRSRIDLAAWVRGGLAIASCLAVVLAGVEGSRAGADEASFRVPAGHLPCIVQGVWKDGDFGSGKYCRVLDVWAEHSPYDLIVMTTRANKELTDDDVHRQVREAAAYARQRGMRMAMNLDVRLARSAFQRRYPDEMQEVIRLAEVPLSDVGTASVGASPLVLGDHMTGGTTPYVSLAGRVARVYRYRKGPEGIEPDSVTDVTADCRVLKAEPQAVTVAVPCGAETQGCHACLLAAFTHFTPAVFAPHLIPFHDELVREYADAGLAGATIDEWGFPPSYGSLGGNDLWYSRFYERAYAQRTGGRDLVRDCLLMCFGQRGRHGERVAAVNRYLELNRLRNGEIEDRYYRVVKEVLGPESFVGLHATWWPDVCTREFKKNGLDWWIATRDLAQTDESVPWCCRTSLCKKCGSPVWYNEFYNTNLPPYLREVWSGTLAGGRVTYHPRYPRPQGDNDPDFGQTYLLRGPLMRAECRVRMLNFIANTPADCPVAVIFGHACAMNWAGPAHGEAGVKLAGQLRAAGFPADLIPSSEIGSGTLRVDEEGFLRYGPQRYAAMVFYHPELETPQTAQFLRQVADAQKTALYRLGTWTMDFDGRPFDGEAALPSEMAVPDDEAACVRQVAADLRQRGVEPQVALGPSKRGIEIIAQATPAPCRGHARLIDGTRIVMAAEKDPTGDPIQTTLVIDAREVEVDALGVVGVRLDGQGQLEAVAAGGLKHLRTGPTEIRLSRRLDLALWRGDDGRWHGVVQDGEGDVPPALAALTDDWLRLAVPRPWDDAHGPSSPKARSPGTR